MEIVSTFPYLMIFFTEKTQLFKRSLLQGDSSSPLQLHHPSSLCSCNTGMYLSLPLSPTLSLSLSLSIYIYIYTNFKSAYTWESLTHNNELMAVFVVQMGTNFKSAVLEEQTANVIRQWHATVKQKRKKQKDHSQSLHDYSTTTWGSSRTSPHDLSPHRRSPNFSTEITAIGTESETIPDHQQEIVVQDEHTPADHTVSSIAVQIEMPEISISRT